MLQEKVINAMYAKRTEIHYNEWIIKTTGNKSFKIELQGKIKCPLLNCNISSLTCLKLMSKEDWPRGIDQNICDKMNCYIHKSIAKFKADKTKDKK